MKISDLDLGKFLVQNKYWTTNGLKIFSTTNSLTYYLSTGYGSLGKYKITLNTILNKEIVPSYTYFCDVSSIKYIYRSIEYVLIFIVRHTSLNNVLTVCVMENNKEPTMIDICNLYNVHNVVLKEILPSKYKFTILLEHHKLRNDYYCKIDRNGQDFILNRNDLESFTKDKHIAIHVDIDAYNILSKLNNLNKSEQIPLFKKIPNNFFDISFNF